MSRLVRAAVLAAITFRLAGTFAVAECRSRWLRWRRCPFEATPAVVIRAGDDDG